MLSLRMSSLIILALGLIVLPIRAIMAAQNSGTPAQASGPNFRIAGTIVSAADGHPLARARVSIFDTKNPRFEPSMITGDDGHFEFKQLPPGKYSLQGAKRGYIRAAYDEHEQFSTAIVTGAGLDTEALVLRLAPTAVLAGTVLDEAGDPVRHANVTLWREDHRSGVSRIVRMRGEATDDLGFYEFTPLDAGTYFVSASGKPWYAVHPMYSRQEGIDAQLLVDRSLDVAYPTTYYAGATEWEDAIPIPIRGGNHLEVDIHLTPVPALHLLFHVSENGENGFSIPTLQKRAFDEVDAHQDVDGQMVSPGVFELTGIVPGRYTVLTPASGGRAGRANAVIDVTQDTQELDTSSGESLSNLTASVQVQGETKLPQGLAIALRDGQRRVVAWRPVDEKGEVNFQDVVPGKYEVRAGSPSKAYSVIRISSPSGGTSCHTLNVAPGSSLKLSLSLVGGSVSIEGFVKRAGKPAPGAMVVLVPSDPDSNRELFRRDQSDLDGSFRLASVIPGSYKVVAIENGWDLDWAQPATIAIYCRHRQTVTVGDHGQTLLKLPEPIEVQPR